MIDEVILMSLWSGIWILTVGVLLCLWMRKESALRKENEEWHKKRKEWHKELKENNKRLGLDENYLLEDDSKREVKYLEEPGTPTIIGCLGYGLVFYFLVVVIYILLEM